MRHRLDRDGSCSFNGYSAEKSFLDMAKDRGFIVTKATTTEDMLDHVDYTITNPKTNISKKIDVKAMKRIQRSGPLTDQYIWLELHGVNSGNEGWIIGGKADFIIFETLAGFLWVPRTELVVLISNILAGPIDYIYDNDGTNVIPRDGKYFIYQRHGRLDQLVLVEKEKIERIAVLNWIKLNGEKICLPAQNKSMD